MFELFNTLGRTNDISDMVWVRSVCSVTVLLILVKCDPCCALPASPSTTFVYGMGKCAHYLFYRQDTRPARSTIHPLFRLMRQQQRPNCPDGPRDGRRSYRVKPHGSICSFCIFVSTAAFSQHSDANVDPSSRFPPSCVLPATLRCTSKCIVFVVQRLFIHLNWEGDENPCKFANTSVMYNEILEGVVEEYRLRCKLESLGQHRDPVKNWRNAGWNSMQAAAREALRFHKTAATEA